MFFFLCVCQHNHGFLTPTLTNRNKKQITLIYMTEAYDVG